MIETSNLFKTEMSELIELGDIPEVVNNNIQEQINRLCQEHRYILNCQVLIKVPTFQPEGCYQIQVVITLPNRDLIVERSPNPDYYQEDIYVAIWSAFNLVRKKIQDHWLHNDDAIGTPSMPTNLRPPSLPLRRSIGYAGG